MPEFFESYASAAAERGGHVIDLVINIAESNHSFKFEHAIGFGILRKEPPRLNSLQGFYLQHSAYSFSSDVMSRGEREITSENIETLFATLKDRLSKMVLNSIERCDGIKCPVREFNIDISGLPEPISIKERMISTEEALKICDDTAANLTNKIFNTPEQEVVVRKCM